MASNNFINECKKRTNANRLGKISIDKVSSPITNSDNLQSLTIDSGCYVDGNIIGTIYIKKLTGNFISIPDNIDLIDKKIQVEIGVKYDDNSTEYINMGRYNVERPKDEQTANMCEITAYDDLLNNIDKEYVCNIDFTSGDKTVSDVYIDVCNQLKLAPKTTTFLNSDIPVKGNLFLSRETNRKVLEEIGKVSSSFIQIESETNKIDLCWLSENDEPDYTFKTNDYAELEGGKIRYGPINSIVIKDTQFEGENVTKQDDLSITLNGENEIAIEDCYFLYTEELRWLAINNIFNRLNGLTYIDCKLTTYYGKPFLPIGAKLRINQNDGKTFDTYNLKHNFTYDGTFLSIIESPALTKQETKTKNTSISKKFKQIERITNKVDGKLQDIVQEVDEQNTKISNVEQTLNSINQTISEDYNFLKTKEGKQQLLLDDSLQYQPVSFEIDGNTNKNFIYPSNNLYPMSDTYSIGLGEGE